MHSGSPSRFSSFSCLCSIRLRSFTRHRLAVLISHLIGSVEFMISPWYLLVFARTNFTGLTRELGCSETDFYVSLTAFSCLPYNCYTVVFLFWCLRLIVYTDWAMVTSLIQAIYGCEIIFDLSNMTVLRCLLKTLCATVWWRGSEDVSHMWLW